LVRRGQSSLSAKFPAMRVRTHEWVTTMSSRGGRPLEWLLSGKDPLSLAIALSRRSSAAAKSKVTLSSDT